MSKENAVKDFVDKKAEKRFPKRSSVSSLNRFISYISGLTDGIGLMAGWAKFYEENKFRIFTTEKLTEYQLLEMYLNTLNP